ncbi:hypothetical protein ACFSMW_09805 [Virgibacillus halophilus]|uniref:hypothetical protein n=1 Tax=Tigheibacillus halophilus TaxID=361280 RepID=UPI00363650E1
MSIGMIAVASTMIWIAVIYEIMKPSKEQNNRKIIILTSFGTLSTLMITIALFQDLPF